jgi:hypothetical protein
MCSSCSKFFEGGGGLQHPGDALAQSVGAARQSRGTLPHSKHTLPRSIALSLLLRR